MAKTTAPLLSFGAAGQIGRTQVYASWKGRGYARRYTIPANPRSADQTLTRDTFAFLQAVYKLMPALASAPWELFAKGKVLTGRNAFTKSNLANLRTASDLSDFIFSPGALGGPPPESMTPVGGSGTITTAVVAPASTPVGWSITQAVVAAIADGDPQSSQLYAITAGFDASNPYSVVLSGLDAGDYEVGAWLQWLRPDGLIAYSPSIQDTATVT